MGAGAVLDEALAELERLPVETREREVAVTSLVALRRKIPHDPTEEERAFLMSTAPIYDQWEKKVKDVGRREGRDEGQRAMLLAQLRTRFGALPRGTTSRVKAASSADLGEWAKRVLTAGTLDEVFE